MFVPPKRGSVHRTSPRFPSAQPMSFLNLPRVLCNRLRSLHCHHAIVVTPRRAPHRSFRPSGVFPTADSSLGAPSGSYADHAHPKRVKVIACIVTCSSPSSLERSTRASMPTSLAYEPCTALSVEQTRSHPGQFLPMTPPKGLHQTSPSSPIRPQSSRSHTANIQSTSPLAARSVCRPKADFRPRAPRPPHIFPRVPKGRRDLSVCLTLLRYRSEFVSTLGGWTRLPAVFHPSHTPTRGT
jgi:hypothetical protein